MLKNIRQSSGVAGGIVDSPRHTASSAEKMQAGRALARRKHGGVRGRKLATRRKSSPRR